VPRLVGINHVALEVASIDEALAWGNLLQVVDYRDVQFTKSPEVLRGMGLEGLGKSDSARRELEAKGLV